MRATCFLYCPSCSISPSTSESIVLFAACWCFPIAYGVFAIFATASRGGLISLFVCFPVCPFRRGSARQRMSAVIVGGVLVLAIPILLSGTNALERLGSLFGGQHEEAKESGDARDYLLRQSITYTFKHPVFGIGMDQFPNYEGRMSPQRGCNRQLARDPQFRYDPGFQMNWAFPP